MRKEDGRHYWQDDDPLKNFPAARSAALKLCDGGDSWGCEQAARSFGNGLGGGKDYPRALNLAQQACQSPKHSAGRLRDPRRAVRTRGKLSSPTCRAPMGLYQTACNQGDLQGCFALGRLYAQGTGVTEDYAQANALFARACDGGDMMGCNGLGALYAFGIGVPRDPDKAISLWQKACNGGVMKSCENVGHAYLSGQGVAKDDAQALTYLRKGCTGGLMDSCSDLGLMYQNGRGVPKDGQEAAKLYTKACDGGATIGCSNLGNLYDSGDGVTKDEIQAAAYFRKSCDARRRRSYGCNNLGTMYETGRGVNKDPREALRLYNRACDGGTTPRLPQRCQSLFEWARHSEGPVEAVRLLRKTCDGGDQVGCVQLGAQLFSGQGVPKNETAAAGLVSQGLRQRQRAGLPRPRLRDAERRRHDERYRRRHRSLSKDVRQGRHGGLHAPRHHVSDGHRRPRDDTQADPLYRKACDGGDMLACTQLAYAYLEGNGVTKDVQQTIALDRKACSNQAVTGCTTLAFIYATGAGRAER